MDNLTFTKDALLKTIKENRAKHKDLYDQAIIGYRNKSIKELSEQLELAKAGKKFSTFFGLNKPKHSLKEYDQAIAMLEMSADTEVVLSRQEFNQYVLDNWSWKGNFIASTAAYTSTGDTDDATEDEDFA